MAWQDVIESAGKAVDAAGIAVIVLGALFATGIFLRYMRRTGEVPDAYTRYRRGIGRAILLGLEFLVAADIIRTVAIDPTFRSVGILAIIVLIRTFLSLELELEIDGRWPWQRHGERTVPTEAAGATPGVAGETARDGHTAGPGNRGRLAISSRGREEPAGADHSPARPSGE